ncbi:MAG: hypothetical protein ACOCTH_00370 [Halodesulfurarchaeum sp.]
MLPLFIFDLVEQAAEWLLGDAGRAMVVLTLAVLALYFRKMLGLGEFLAGWVGKIVFTLVVLAALIAVGIIPGVNVDVAVGLVESAINFAIDLVGDRL